MLMKQGGNSRKCNYSSAVKFYFRPVTGNQNSGQHFINSLILFLSAADERKRTGQNVGEIGCSSHANYKRDEFSASTRTISSLQTFPPIVDGRPVDWSNFVHDRSLWTRDTTTQAV